MPNTDGSPRVMSTDESLGTDPEVNQRVRYYLQRYPRAESAEIAREMELNEWIVARALRKMHTDHRSSQTKGR